ncbi:MAG TPA: hypothetical protein VD767_09595 [Thermomicrobiales bacterium]|nr:hypothetical protein [Thermomicrobiales bacterium]
MSTFSLDSFLGQSISRRTAVKGALGVALASAIPLRGLEVLAAQATDVPEVVIVTKEMSFEMPATIDSGLTRVTMDNQGMMGHHAMLMRVNDDATLEDLEAALTQPDFGAIFAVSQSIGGPSAGPGSTGSVVLDLLPGTYIAICAIPDENGMPHYALGMQATFEVTDSGAAGTAPEAALTIELMEMMFHGFEGTPVAAGPQTWEVVNAGAQLHELVLLKLAPGVTYDQFEAMMMAPPEASPMAEMDMGAATPAAEMAGPPFTENGGVAPMSPGYTNYFEADLVAGEYAVICFVPDPETGAPHFALGMIAGISVA